MLKKLRGESLLELWLCKTFCLFMYFICIVCILLSAANGVINDDDYIRGAVEV